MEKEKANVVGHIDLKAGNAFKLREEIERLLQDRWLDGDTAQEFKKQIYTKDPLKLKAIKSQVQAEIQSRKKAYGA
jgi:hypothetical protein